jgi:hypothetical protein
MLDARTGDVIEVLNTGAKSITIQNIVFNDRSDCVATLPSIANPLSLFGQGPPLSQNPIPLNVGQKGLFSAAPCFIVRATIETDKGSATYSFTGN